MNFIGVYWGNKKMMMMSTFGTQLFTLECCKTKTLNLGVEMTNFPELSECAVRADTDIDTARTQKKRETYEDRRTSAGLLSSRNKESEIPISDVVMTMTDDNGT
jgi:hypothetical protein